MFTCVSNRDPLQRLIKFSGLLRLTPFNSYALPKIAGTQRSVALIALLSKVLVFVKSPKRAA
jgi:hypothetical protein